MNRLGSPVLGFYYPLIGLKPPTLYVPRTQYNITEAQIEVATPIWAILAKPSPTLDVIRD